MLLSLKVIATNTNECNTNCRNDIEGFRNDLLISLSVHKQYIRRQYFHINVPFKFENIFYPICTRKL